MNEDKIITDEDIEKVRNGKYVSIKVSNREEMWENIRKT
jgi:hypothetical protein